LTINYFTPISDIKFQDIFYFRIYVVLSIALKKQKTMSQDYEVVTKKMTSKPVYFKNTIAKVVIRSTSGANGKFYVKGHRRDEYEIAYWTNLVYETILDANEITKKQYENY
jgi:hypothetical protein